MSVFFILISVSSTLISPGKPELPVIRKLIKGDTSAITINIIYKETTVTEEIPPAPPPVRKGSPTPEITRDPDVYKRDIFYPGTPYSFKYLGVRRGTPYYILEIHPYQYNHVAGKVRYAEEIDISGYRENYPPYKGNGEDTILIVVPIEFVNYIDFFVFCKEVSGYNVEILGMQSGWSNSRLRNEIIAIKPDYLLLIGDESYIPSFRVAIDIPGYGTDYRNTDLYYACFDGDYLPDSYYGRISIDNIFELNNVINKTLNFDSLGANWKRRAFFMASDDPWYYRLTEETCKYSMNKARNNYMSADSHFAANSGNPGTSLNEAFSEGRSIAAYTGHGLLNKWQGPEFDFDDINSLPDNMRTPIIFSFACNTGDFASEDCFLEHWNNVEKKGAVLSFGSSTYSYWIEDDILQRRIFDVLLSGKEIGAVIDTAKLLFSRDYAGDSVFIQSYYQQYNIIGDPTIKPKTGTESKTVINIPLLTYIGDTIPVSINGEGAVGLYQSDRKVVYDIGKEGSVKIPIEGFREGSVRVVARAGDDLMTTKFIHISSEPIEDLFSVYPTVTNSDLNISFFAIRGYTYLRVYDILGREILKKRYIYFIDGIKEETLNIGELNTGIYYLSVSQGNIWLLTEKIIKI